MWLIRDKALMRLPDGASIPAGFKEVEPPEDFEANPTNYRIHKSKIVPLSKKEKEAARQSTRLFLTQEEIAKIKLAIEKGII
ncbi:hypothetical protein BQ8794_50730 [Mesorhizobium prunaredense]|uniref:Uncharacterized protein n=1 Tax=Mesorhizobium prunaredense TaxID=1631249 RepID=A0A1R3VFK0_9HYPH|nr:hypothetical protein [Mesorhizobium prunaredense]SIT58628.1 hypothetical protein BQ8794_50730 [Mesorhizobium prunaredense]